MSLHFIILIKITRVSSEQQHSCKNATKSTQLWSHSVFKVFSETQTPVAALFHISSSLQGRSRCLTDLRPFLTRQNPFSTSTNPPFCFGFWPVGCSLTLCPYHPNTIGGWSLHSTFTVQMLSFQWHFKQSLSIYSHSGFMSFDKMPLANRVITICGSKVNFFCPAQILIITPLWQRWSSECWTGKINTRHVERTKWAECNKVLIFSSGRAAQGQTAAWVWWDLIVLLSIKQRVIIIAYLIIL